MDSSSHADPPPLCPSLSPYKTVPRLTWWGTGSLDSGLRPSSGVVAMAAAAAMAEEAASGSTGSSRLCSCFTMTEHNLCPSTQAPCSTSGERGRTQAQGAPGAQGSAPLLSAGSQKTWGHLLHSAANRLGLDNRPEALLTGCVTLGKLSNLSEP